METRACSVALVTRACSVVRHDTNPLLARVPPLVGWSGLVAVAVPLLGGAHILEGKSWYQLVSIGLTHIKQFWMQYGEA